MHASCIEDTSISKLANEFEKYETNNHRIQAKWWWLILNRKCHFKFHFYLNTEKYWGWTQYFSGNIEIRSINVKFWIS